MHAWQLAAWDPLRWDQSAHRRASCWCVLFIILLLPWILTNSKIFAERMPASATFFLTFLLICPHELSPLPSAFPFTPSRPVIPTAKFFTQWSHLLLILLLFKSAVLFLLFILAREHAKGNLYSLLFLCLPTASLWAGSNVSFPSSTESFCYSSLTESGKKSNPVHFSQVSRSSTFCHFSA